MSKAAYVLVPFVLAFSATSSLALAEGVSPLQASAAERDSAQKHFLKGKDLVTARKYDAALKELNASLDAVASPNTRLMISRCKKELGDVVGAHAELVKTEAEARELAKKDAKYGKTADAAADERKELESQLGLVEISVANATDATTLTVAGKEVPRARWAEPIAVVPGSAEIVVSTPGHAPVTSPLQIAAGESKRLHLDAAGDTDDAKVEPPPAKPDLRPYAFVAGGVAVVGLATFAIAGLMANSTYSDLESACGSGPCPPGREDDISSGRTQQTIANVGLAVFLIGGATAAGLWLVGAPKAGAQAAQTAQATPVRSNAQGATIRIRPTVGPTYLGLGGTF